MIGIIDIGSNTIRLVTYENGKKNSNISVNSEILKDTENNRLTKIGTQKLCFAIKKLKDTTGEIPLSAFATFAFRELENREEVKNIILQETGVSVEILSGKDEAECDFAALKNEIGENESGIGVDLGGGSAQIFSFQDGNLKFCESYAIGCKKIKESFVKGVFPTVLEEKKIEDYIENVFLGFDKSSEKLYIMGGTAKTAAKMYSFLKGEEIEEIFVENLPQLIRFIEEAPEELMKNVLKARYDNIVVGIIIMETIAKRCGAKVIHIKKCSVRDGYIINRDIKNT